MTRFLLVFTCALLAPATLLAQSLSIATYNVRNDNAGDAKQGNGWQQRHPVIAGLITFHDFDIVGTQEAFHHQVNDLLTGLPEYTSVGVGRDDGKNRGEHAAIFFKKNRFTEVKNDTFWLAPDTTRPNKGWDAALPRICTWVELEERSSKKRIFVFNIHFDHVGVEARRESAKLLIRKVDEIAADAPAILMGDFNVDQDNEIYGILNGTDQLKDSFALAPVKYVLNGTFNNFSTKSQTNSRIDHIFLTNHFKAKRYGVLTDTYRSAEGTDGRTYTSANFPREVSLKTYTARLPSDHFPVNVVVELQ